MSHYSVLVLTEGGDGSDVDEALAPFDESTEVEPYVFKEHGDAVSELAGFYGEHGIDDGLRDSIDGEIRRAADGYGADPDAAIASLMRDASDIGREIGGTGADATGPMDARLTGRRDDPLALAVSTGAYIALARAYYGDVGVDGDLNLLTTYNRS